MSVVDVVVAIAALCVVIILHEFGHYITAVWSGMKVDRFSVFGIGPAILKLGTWRGTEIVVSAIPFGAYVLIRGMEPEDPDDASDAPTDPGVDPAPPPSENFRDKPLPARAAVLAGGPIFNYLTAIVLYFLVFAVAGLRGPVESIRIDGFTETSPAQTAGMEVGDQLVAIDGTAIDPTLGGTDVAPLADAHRGQTTPITVRRDDALKELEVAIPAEGSPLGVQMRPEAGPRVAIGIGEAVRRGVAEPFLQTQRQLSALWLLITGRLQASLSGPVEIVHQIARSADLGWVPFIEMTALISTLLGMFNLLPLPALDGGRLAFLLYEAIARRRASPRVEEMVHGYGMLALLALLLLVTVGDVRRLF